MARYYQSRQFKILAQRFKTPFAEVDLLVREPSGLCWMIEVKSQSAMLDSGQRISRRQAQRLLRSYQYLSAQKPFSLGLRFALAVVSHKNQVDLFEDVLSDLLEP